MAITTFVASQILTAAQMNAVQSNDYNQTVSTKTASYTLVAADKGTRIVMNVTGASTVTVNTSLFSAGDTLTIQNISATACTVTAGTATVSSAGPLAIPQNGSGLLYFTSAGVSIFYPSAVTVSGSGFNFITGATFSAATSFSLPASTFSATYQNYKIMVNVTDLTADASFTMRMRVGGADATSSDYFYGFMGITSTGVAADINAGAASAWAVGESDGGSLDMFVAGFDIFNPFATVKTQIQGNQTMVNQAATAFVFRSGGATINLTTSYDSLSFISSVASSMTGFYRVYGYAES